MNTGEDLCDDRHKQGRYRESKYWLVLSARNDGGKLRGTSKRGLVEGRGVEPPTPTLRT